MRIALGKGVCGTAAQTRQTQVVRDVHEFPGHIACDSASQSEIVVPLVAPDGTLIGVWDVDSPVVARFDDEDAKGMEALCAVFIEAALPRDVVSGVERQDRRDSVRATRQRHMLCFVHRLDAVQGMGRRTSSRYRFSTRSAHDMSATNPHQVLETRMSSATVTATAPFAADLPALPRVTPQLHLR